MTPASCWQEIGRLAVAGVTFGIGFLIPWLLYRTENNMTQFVHEPVSYVFILLFFIAACAVMFTFEVKQITVQHLKTWNGLLFVLHLASGVVLAWLAKSKGTWTAYITFGRSQWGRVSNATAPSGFSADSCQDGGCFVRTVPCLLSEANIEYMVLAFHLLSTLQHLAVVLDWRGHYTENIQNGNHWMRWFEYAFSASIMFVSWCVLCGIYDVIALVPLAVCVGTVQCFGYLSDAAARSEQDWSTESQSGNVEYKQVVSAGLSCVSRPITSLFSKLSVAHNRVTYVCVYVVYDVAQFAIFMAMFWVDSETFAWQAAFVALGGVALCLLKVAPYATDSTYSTQVVKVVGILYVTYAAVLAWPMVTHNVDTLRLVTQVVLGLHVGLILAHVAVCCLQKCRDDDRTPQWSLYPIQVQPTQPTLSSRSSLTADSAQPFAVNRIWIFTLAWVPYLLGAWFMTVVVFRDSIMHPGPNSRDPPDALHVIIVSQFLFFSCFAGAQIWYLWKPHRQRYLDTEFYFCLLSLVSKTALAWSLYSGAASRKDLGLRATGAMNDMQWC